MSKNSASVRTDDTSISASRMACRPTLAQTSKYALPERGLNGSEAMLLPAVLGPVDAESDSPSLIGWGEVNVLSVDWVSVLVCWGGRDVAGDCGVGDCDVGDSGAGLSSGGVLCLFACSVCNLASRFETAAGFWCSKSPNSVLPHDCVYGYHQR